jgi:hypothetical protein
MEGSTGVYECTPPGEHPYFESYVVRASSKHGVCWVKGIGKNIDDNGYGTNTVGRLKGFADAMTPVYGEPRKVDLILPNALWDDADEYLMSIRQNERTLAYVWEGEELGGKTKLNQIYVFAKALSRDTGWVGIEYYSEDHEACKSTSNAVDNSVL